MMNILSFIKNIYFGKTNVLNHITLFSLFGIMTITLNNALAFYWGVNLIGYMPSSLVELFLDSVVGLLILFLSLGYGFRYTNRMLNTDIYALPSVSMRSLVVLIKMIPLFIVWAGYYFVLVMLGLNLFRSFTIWYYLYFSLLLCCAPFLGIIYTAYSKKFDLNMKYFKFISFLRVIKVSLGDMLKLFAQVLFVVAIIVLLEREIFVFANKISSEQIQIAVRLLGCCFGVYFLNIVNYLIAQGLVHIVKKYKMV